MLLSKQNMFSDSQAVTVTAASTNAIDLGAVGTPVRSNALARDVSKGQPVGVLIKVDTTFTAGGSATMTVSIETDDNDAFSSATTKYTSAAIPVATLVAGYRLPIDWLPASVNERYMRVYYTIATGPMTAGNITAALTLGNDSKEW